MFTDGVTALRRLVRVLAVTVGLMITGAFFASLAGAASLTTALWIEQDPWYLLGLIGGPVYGAPLGAILAPVFAWTFLRRVPLGQMFVWLSAGTAIGGVVGWITTYTTLEGPKVVAGLAGAVIGCLVAAVRLRYQVRRLEA